MARQVVTFDHFDGGDFGLLGEREAPRGSWSGQNVLRYADGSLGPRSGLVNLGTTSAPAGSVLGFGRNPTAGFVWFIVGTTVLQFSSEALTQAAVTVGTVAIAPPNKIARVSEPGGLVTLFSVYGDKGYLIDHPAVSLTAYAAHPGGRMSTLLGDRGYTAGTSANPTRLFYSAPGDVSAWPAANYIDVGYGGIITGLHVAYGRLVIVKTDGTWWVLSGTPGYNDVLREIIRSEIPSPEAHAAVVRQVATPDGKVWFVPIAGDYPAAFTGVTITRREHLSLTALGEPFPDGGTIPEVGITRLVKTEQLLIVTGVNSSSYDRQGLLFAGGVWSRHTFAKNISGWVDGHGDVNHRVYLCDGGGVGVVPKFYAWSYGLNRPPFSGNAFESKDDAGAAFSADVTLPAWWHTGEGELQIAAVLVEFRKWNHGFGGNNSFALAVVPLRMDGGAGSSVVTSGFVEAATAASTSGTDDFITLPVTGPIYGDGFRLAFTGLVGVAIQRVRVLLDTRPVQGVDNV